MMLNKSRDFHENLIEVRKDMIKWGDNPAGLCIIKAAT